jgi:Fic family protein
VDASSFSKESPGALVPITDGELAFVPHPLPPAWEFPARLWPLLAEAKQYVGELNGIGSVLPSPMLLLRPLSDREAIQSSRLEGTYATPKELLLFELQPKDATTESARTNEFREVFNYQQALKYGTTSDLPLSLRLIRSLHHTLLAGVRGRDKTPGEFRKVQVAIGATRRFIPPPPHKVRECLDPLEKYLHDTALQFDPLVFCFLVHYQFETIHPFVDGNGRVGRLLLAIMLQQRCRLDKPWLYMSGFFEKHREDYTSLLFSVSARASWSEWIEFCLSGTLAQAKDTIARCRKLIQLRESFAERVARVGGNVRLSRIVEDTFTSPFVQVSALSKRLEVTYPTARADIDRLVEAGVLRELRDTTPRTFYAPEVFDVAYGDLDGDLDEDGGESPSSTPGS